MNRILLTLFLVVHVQLVSSQPSLGELSFYLVDSLPTYYHTTTDTSKIREASSAEPLRIPGKLNLLDSNSFFISECSNHSDSIYTTQLAQIRKLKASKMTSLTSKKAKSKKWKLILIHDYGAYIPCCRPNYQVNNVFFLEPKNVIFTLGNLEKSFNADSFKWGFSNLGDKFLKVSFSFSYIGNDSADGGTYYIFKLIEDE